MGELSNFIGKEFGDWTVIADAPKKHNKAYLLCRCVCGKERTVIRQNLEGGRSRSCGCSRNHQMSSLPEYQTWKGIKARCLNKRHVGYKQYGGSGVTVCDRWLADFRNFYNDMGKKPSPSHSIDRIDSSGDYEPSNCRWATSLQQTHNQRVRKDSKTGIRGVHVSCGYAVASWHESGIRNIVKFSIKKYGEEEALRLATDLREKKYSLVLEEIF